MYLKSWQSERLPTVKIFVVATTAGLQPCMPIRGESMAKKALELVKRGWPDYQWKTYELEVEQRIQGVKASRPTLKLGHITDIAVREVLRTELKSRFPNDFDIE